MGFQRLAWTGFHAQLFEQLKSAGDVPARARGGEMAEESATHIRLYFRVNHGALESVTLPRPPLPETLPGQWDKWRVETHLYGEMLGRWGSHAIAYHSREEAFDAAEEYFGRAGWLNTRHAHMDGETVPLTPDGYGVYRGMTVKVVPWYRSE